LSHFGQVEGATINAKSFSFGDVRSAVAFPKDGDQIRNNPSVNQRTGTAAWPTQQRDLIYVWSDTFLQIPNKTVFHISIMGPSPCIRRGRGIINNGTTPKPGYKPYTYPHPLVSGVPATKTAEDRRQTAEDRGPRTRTEWQKSEVGRRRIDVIFSLAT
jgi:hypothetical protein